MCFCHVKEIPVTSVFKCIMEMKISDLIFICYHCFDVVVIIFLLYYYYYRHCHCYHNFHHHFNIHNYHDCHYHHPCHKHHYCYHCHHNFHMYKNNRNRCFVFIDMLLILVTVIVRISLLSQPFYLVYYYDFFFLCIFLTKVCSYTYNIDDNESRIQQQFKENDQLCWLESFVFVLLISSIYLLSVYLFIFLFYWSCWMTLFWQPH